MGSTVRLILILSLLLLISALNTATCTAKSFQSLTTTDLSFTAKTQFAPGDYIRYNVKFTVPMFSLVFVKGMVRYSGASLENLTLQFAVFGKGDQQIFWDSIVPKLATGDATVRVTFIGIPGGLAVQSTAFTVSGGPVPTAEFIGSDACYLCHTGLHPDIVSAYKESGHHFALNAVSGSAPVYPAFAPGVPNPPGSLAWSDIPYTVGGYGWKANFLAGDGHILTGTATQYNLANSILATAAQFVPYEPLLAGPKPFTCGACHTTGYVAEGSQGDLTYIVGTWNENGVGCEACHGPGSAHQANPAGVKPALDPAMSCARCHSGSGGPVAAGSGFIVSQQQALELAAGAKDWFTCGSCHNAHASAHYDDQASGSGITQQCTACHGQKKIGLSMGSLECIDCHMPFAVKSGASINFTDADNNNLGQADVRSHIFTINAAAASPSDMFSADGTTIATGTDGKAKGLTLDFVCLGCHRPGGRAATTYTFNQVKGLAPSVHQ